MRPFGTGGTGSRVVRSKRVAIMLRIAALWLGRRRGHEIVPHTADVGVRARGPDLPALFEEAAAALAELATSLPPRTQASTWEELRLEATDLPGLAFAWLNELIALGEVHRSALVDVRVDRLAACDAEDGARGWCLEARVGLRPYDGRVRALRQPKSATFHRLVVDAHDGVLTMEAYLDV